MPFFYQSGQEINKGDRVTYHDEPGEIEFIAEKIVGDDEIDWHVTEHGGGVMIFAPKRFGHVFVHDAENDEDLVLIARARSQ
jgi:hypothetical protein